MRGSERGDYACKKINSSSEGQNAWQQASCGPFTKAQADVWTTHTSLSPQKRTVAVIPYCN